MKKIMIILFGLLLIISVAFAENTVEKQPKSGEKPEEGVATSTLYGNEDNKSSANEKGNHLKEGNGSNENKIGPVMVMNGTEVHAGLYNALSNVKNENARAALTRNMERFMEKYQNKLQKYNNVSLEVDEDTQEMSIKAKKEVKYLGFIKGSATDKIQIEKNGEIKEKKPWYRFMYAESEE